MKRPLVRCPACDVLGWIDSLPGGKLTCRVCRYTWTPNNSISVTAQQGKEVKDA